MADGLLELVVFGGLLCWIFNDSLRAMVDCLSTKLQEVCSNWKQDDVKHRQVITTRGGLQLMVNSYKSRRKQLVARNKELSQQSQDRSLFQIKETEWTPVSESQSRPFVGLSCKSCTPSSRNSLLDKNTKNASLIDVLQVESLDNHPDHILAKIFPHLAQACTFKQHDFPYIYDTVIKDERMKEILEESAKNILENSKNNVGEDSYLTILAKQKERAVRILNNLRSTFSDIILRIGSWVMTKVMTRLFTNVVVHPAHIEMLKKASSTGLPLIFLPLHRSHFDYIVITYILCFNNIRSPLVAAGENLRIPIFGWLLRGLGAFFIKRRIDPVQGKKDVLYRAILHTYMTECLRAGHNFEFFIEGGRTRSGKACMPKGGLLSVFVDTYIDGTIEDALLVPVSINYEKLVDGNFVCEQMGQPKQMESFSSALKGIWRAFTSHYGIMRVDFNQPFSLRELVRSFQSRLSIETNSRRGTSGPNGKVLCSLPSTASLYGTDVVVEEQRLLVDSIARHIVYDCCRTTAVMSTNAVSFLLLNAYRDGVKMETLVNSLDSLRSELHNIDIDLGFTGESVDVIEHALDILGPGLVRKERDTELGCVMIRPVIMLPNVIELSYYSNCVLPHFILEAVTATAIKSSITEGQPLVTYNDLVEKALLICDILQFEFIFTKTCQNIESALSEIIDNFVTNEILSREQKLFTEEELWSQRLAARLETEFDEEEEEDCPWGRQPPFQVNVNNERYKLYNVLLQPFLDAYCVSANQLHQFESSFVSERDYIKKVLDVITVDFGRGLIQCGESVSFDTIRNSLKLFERWNVLSCHTQGKMRVYYLTTEYAEESQLDEVINKFKQFR